MKHKLRRINFGEEERAEIIQKQKRTLERLVKENSGSRNLIDKLIEQGTAKTKFLVSSEKELAELEEQLRKITIKLDSEGKRNEVLKELVSIFNNEDKQSKKEELDEVNRLVSQREKLVRKQEYDIEQILQKHNEEIAKINILKEQISGSRRERVVYSNLFKKIEKEIKVYEESYKQILMEAHDNEKKQKLLCDEVCQRKRTEKSQKSFQLDHYQAEEKEDQVMQSIDLRAPLAVESIYVESSAPTSVAKRVISKNSAMIDSLNEYRLFFDVLKCQTGEESEEDIIHKFPELAGENERIVSLIEDIDDSILKKTESLREFHASNANCELETQISEEMREAKYQQQQNNILLEEVQEREKDVQSFEKCLWDVARMLNIQPNQSHLQEIFQQIENKVIKLNPEERQPTLSSETVILKKTGEFETHIQAVIEKMEAYEESEKILSKHHLENECSKELTKHKKQTRLRRDKF